MKRAEFFLQEDEFKRKALHWAGQFHHCVFLDSCSTEIDKFGKYDFLLGVGNAEPESWKSLEDFRGNADNKAWKFGLFSYDLKNKIEPILKTESEAAVSFPELYFFSPSIVIGKKRGSDKIFVEAEFPKNIFEQISEFKIDSSDEKSKPEFSSDLFGLEYLNAVENIRNHIKQGDCYELNLCRNFISHSKIHSPVSYFEKLISLNPVPFAALARFGTTWILCASPERFLKLDDGTLITQPIKGTAPRNSDPVEDERLKRALAESEKDKAENVMIVDLSRNDLYKSSEVNGVEVTNLFEVQTFPQVHHLVSTIEAKKRKDISSLDAILHAFPPGSMTGAPKIRVCELIEKYETHARGIYSGALGYFTPENDFDFNVVIRTLIYDDENEVCSFHSGGAITWDSVAQKELEETELKAKAVLSLFE